MNEYMVKKWNDVVSYDDIVVHLGDFALTRNYTELKNIRNKLKGCIILIKGNHDNVRNLKKVGISVLSNSYFRIGNLLLSHRPFVEIRNNNLVNVHGHIHNKKTNGRRINVCVDVTEFKPVKIEKYFKQADKILEESK